MSQSVHTIGQFVVCGSIRLFSVFSVHCSISSLRCSHGSACATFERRTPMPRSALHHRPIESDTDRQGKRRTTMTGITPVAQRASRLPKQTEKGGEWKRTAGDGDETKSDRASAPVSTPTKNPPKPPRMKHRGILRGHPLLYLGIGMMAMLALWTLLTLAVTWWNTTWDDIHYGRARRLETDAVGGNNDSLSNRSHFIALNLNGRIEVIEFPGGDGSKARIYIGPQLYGNGDNLIPVTLSFVDVNGNHRPDMIVHFQNTQLVFINDQGGFRPATPDEFHAVERYLQQHGH